MSDSDLSQALTRLAFDQPFFGTLLAMTALVADPAIPTLATNGERVYYNPKFISTLRDRQVDAVLMHELLHIVYLHCDPRRRAGRDPCRWNAAGDFAINQELASWGFPLPEGALLDGRFQGLTAEAIYERLPRGGACRCLDRLLSLPEGVKEGVQGRILAAAEVAAGRLPAGLSRWIRALRASRVPWNRVLRRFLREALARDEQRFLPPNRRHLWDGRYLPSTSAGPRGRLVAAVDTSGSIEPYRLEAFAAELKGIGDLCEGLLLLTCDAAVHEAVSLDGFGGYLKKLRFTGGGGTDFRPVFDYVEARKLKPDALLYLTDGQGAFPAARPRGYPVLWCLSEPAAVPWGQAVFIAT